MPSIFKIEKNIDPKKFFPSSKHIIIYAFTIGTKHYFRFDDHLNIPYQRGLTSLLFYKEVELNIDSELLKAHFEAVDNILMSTKINVFEIKRLNDLLMQRTKLPKDPELMYKLASVVFFGADENPEVYEFEHGKKKILFWKKNTSLDAFFLSMPLVELIPYLKYAGENLQAFSRLISDVSQTHTDKVLQHLSESQKMILKDKSVSVQAATLPV